VAPVWDLESCQKSASRLLDIQVVNVWKLGDATSQIERKFADFSTKVW
jgi:hypothetical protein